MPSDILLNPDTHDIDLSSGSVVMITDNLRAVAQRVKVAILLKRGEWFQDVLDGVPYYQEFFTVKNNKPFIDQFMVNYIGNVEDVSKVIAYASVIDIPRRVLRISVSVETYDGQIVEINVGELQ